MEHNPYKQLAKRLDDLPNGFPPTDDGVELRLLAKFFSPEEAELASKLRLTIESPEQIAARIGGNPKALKPHLKAMYRKGVIKAGRAESGMGFGLMPFVVGIYEGLLGKIDAETAIIFEDYYQKAYGKNLAIEPSVHRVIPIGESVRMDMEVHPFESVVDIVNGANAWGVIDCICRVQKSMIGDPCEHPVDNCMIFHFKAGVFDSHPVIQSLTKKEAEAKLKHAADVGLVHSVSNTQEGISYICNCCTCSCGILRGLADLGIANAVARSAFVNQVDEELCTCCELCVENCQFEALSLMPEDLFVQINQTKCVGCGVCVSTCLDEALTLVRRPEEEILPTPVTETDWMLNRAAARGITIDAVL